MTTSSTIRFISQVKLGELQRQRSLLVAAYDHISKESSVGPSVDGLESLLRGLRSIKVAGRPLHTDLDHLELLLQGTTPSPEMIDFWYQRLSGEVAKGRLRTDIVYLFGALLGDWGQEGESIQAFLEERRKAHEALLQHALTAPDKPREQMESVFQETFAGFEDRLSSLSDGITQSISEWVETGGNFAVDLSSVAQNIYLPADVRNEARRFRKDPILEGQFGDAIRVVTCDLRDWDWPNEGVSTRAIWTRNKWRLFPNLSLVQINVLNGVGRFWAFALESVFGDSARMINRLSRYQKLLDLNAPPVIIENERRMIADERARVDLGWYEAIDPWEGAPVIQPDKPMMGIVSRRAAEQGALRDSERAPYYEYGSNRMLNLIQAEVRTLRQAYPQRPLFVVNLDVRDYFASIPHEVIERMLQGLGMPEVHVESIRRFLQVPYSIDVTISRARRGVPMNQDLSHWLAEWLLRLMERYVHQRAEVRIVRQIDDICLLAASAQDIVAAWNAVQRFLEDCGLEVNHDKCGACAFDAELPRELPRNRPRWGMLELSSTGDWDLHQSTFQVFCDTTAKHIGAKQSVLDKVSLYNAHLNYLTSAVGLAADLGDLHRRAVNDALRRFESELFGPGQGIVSHLRGAISDRYSGDVQFGHLPESWMHWPITAGGLSLRSAMVMAGQYGAAADQQKKKRLAAPSNRSEDWQYGDAEWSAFYDDQFSELTPELPKESEVMKVLVNDFIARGQEISAGEQKDLSGYWRWILCIYGQEILEKFGTFRFLLTDLVPLQLIHEQLRSEGALKE